MRFLLWCQHALHEPPVYISTRMYQSRQRCLQCQLRGLMRSQVSKSCSFTKQVLTQLDLLKYWQESAACKYDVFFLPKQLDGQVSAVHTLVLGAMLTVFADEHADRIVVKLEGPSRPQPARTTSIPYRVSSMRKWRNCTLRQLVQSPLSLLRYNCPVPSQVQLSFSGQFTCYSFPHT